jgi:hypothetical protein
VKCGVCGNQYRKGTTVYANIRGKLRPHRVCPGCAGKAISILPTEAATRCSCGGVATTCGRCADRRASKPDLAARRIAAKLRSLAKAYRDTFAKTQAEEHDERGRAVGLDQAADIVERGAL